MKLNSPISPFGEISFEVEKKKLGELWEEYFFEHTQFVSEALIPDTYIIVGRRGSGKSSLVQYFNNQFAYSDAICINIDENHNYTPELYEIAQKNIDDLDYATKSLVELWKYVIWQLIYSELSKENKDFKEALDNEIIPGSSEYLKIILKGILTKYVLSNSGELIDLIEKKNKDKQQIDLRAKALSIISARKMFITFDTRERYDIHNQSEMSITSALIECASMLNDEHSNNGLYIKVCLADEVYPYLTEHFIRNTLKHVRNPLFLIWKPKDLLRLVCWRFYKFLKINNYVTFSEDKIMWDNYDDIYTKLWKPYFGEYLINRVGIKERTFPYILRHTHLRPRQLVFICNKIAQLAMEKGQFPKFSNEIIIKGVRDTEVLLADEIINSYSKMYPEAGNIVSALSSSPIFFEGSTLNKIGKRSATYWKSSKYDYSNFMRFITELGIIGRQRGTKDENSRILKADFEFAIKGDRLFINEKDTLVIHPMFYSKLNINKGTILNYCVYPFPDHDDFSMLH